MTAAEPPRSTPEDEDLAEPEEVEGDDLRDLIPDFKRHLKSRNRAPNTIDSYVAIATTFVDFLDAEGMSRIAQGLKYQHFEHYFAMMQDRPNSRTGKPLSASYVAKHYRSLQQFARWLYEKEEVVDRNPFDKLNPPDVPESLPPVLTEAQLRKLLDTTKGKTFENLRDRAILLMFTDTPSRLDEIATLDVDDPATNELGSFDFEADVAHVMGKGRRPRDVPFGPTTGEALRRYLRARKRHPFAQKTTAMWLGRKGALTPWGIRQIIYRRAEEAGVPNVHPHRFRHTFSHRWLANGGQETDLMRLAGWKSRQMLAKYGASAADERAQSAHRRANLTDRL